MVELLLLDLLAQEALLMLLLQFCRLLLKLVLALLPHARPAVPRASVNLVPCLLGRQNLTDSCPHRRCC